MLLESERKKLFLIFLVFYKFFFEYLFVLYCFWGFLVILEHSIITAFASFSLVHSRGLYQES